VTRRMEIRLEKRAVACVAELLDEDAELTCDFVWDALPLAGDIFHAKYASNEIYTLVPPIRGDEPGLENPTVVPAAGDVMYFYFPAGHLGRRWMRDRGFGDLPGLVDLAVFYGRNNMLFNPATGFVPGNVYARIVENFEAFAAAANDVWRSGSVGERLIYRRLEE
jgi:hypothetical protein